MEAGVLTVEQEDRRQENARKAKAAADRLFPCEQWIFVEDSIYRSPRRPIGEKSNYKDELRDAQILRDSGSTVYLVPDDSRQPGKKYDAIVDGLKMEFKNIRGKAETVETQFIRSRFQAVNVFLNLEKSPLTKKEVITALYSAKKSKHYPNIKNGIVVLKIMGDNELCYLDIEDIRA